MTTQDLFTATDFISTITELVSARGMTLEVGSDFAAFEEALKTQPARNPLAPKFSPRNNDLNDDTGFWIVGRDPEGEVVHSQAMRLVDLGGLSLSSHMEKCFKEFSPAGHAIDFDRSRYFSSSGFRAITGTVCYHGELWLKGGSGGYRGAGMTAVLARLALITSLLKWSPDFVFGFMFPLAACKGLAAREGYMHIVPDCLSWAVPEQEDMEIWSVWMAREDLRHILQIPPAGLFEQLENVQGRDQKKAA